MSCKPGNINWLSIYLIFIQFVTLMFVIGLIVTSKLIFIFLYSAFEYSLGLGRNPLRYFQTILFLECTHLKWPTFILGPEKVKDKSGYILGDPDANFAANPYVEKIRTFFTHELNILNQLKVFLPMVRVII